MQTQMLVIKRKKSKWSKSWPAFFMWICDVHATLKSNLGTTLPAAPGWGYITGRMKVCCDSERAELISDSPYSA